MAVTLQRAWEVCRLLDEADAQRAANELDRALALTSPTIGPGKRDGGKATR